MPLLSTQSLYQRRRFLNWFLLVRLVVVCFFVGGTIAYHVRDSGWPPSMLVVLLASLVILTFFQTLISGLFLSRINQFRQFVHAQITWDLLFVTAVLYLTGGVESLYSFLFILVIISASVLMPRGQILIVASAAAILYGSLLDLQYFGYLPVFAGQNLLQDIQEHDVFYAVFLHVGAFYLTAFLGGSLAERLRRSEAAREKWEVDYGELEQLNRNILENINSGLMIVNPEGRIRSFNHSAVKITGYQLQEVYNRPAEIFFPAFANLDFEESARNDRGEAHFVHRDGRDLTLGFSCSPVEDSDGNQVGKLLAFQDLTEYKALEDQLKRADRLAAVGRLASGMAHEIRNPLASISGSVQLLMEDVNISEQNRRLMGIVVKEADRLSQLLSDFLTFARPAPLQLEHIDLAALLDELVSLLTASGQFCGVTIEKDYRQPIMMYVDRQKIWQALWDLMLNAAEAVQPEGQVRLSLNAETGSIIVEDSGPGIAEEIRENIFEPFFTTKEKGTGLGLANVYANIEAHNGRIFVEPGTLGGARFNIELPLLCRTISSQESLDGEPT